MLAQKPPCVRNGPGASWQHKVKGVPYVRHVRPDLQFDRHSRGTRLACKCNCIVEQDFPRTDMDDPDLLFLRMDLGRAEIWSGEMGLLTTAKMAMGKTIHDDVQDKHVETTL